MIPAVEIIGVRKSFGDFTALHEIDLAIAQQSFVSLLGASGCGKTTLLRIVAGFESASSGTVRIAGEDITGVPPHARPTNIVFQRGALFPHMTVRENVGYSLKLRKWPKPKIDAQVDRMLALVRLEGFGDRDPAKLSGGQVQRVALARALASEPRVLLLDEPLSALDLKLRQQMQLELRGLQRSLGATFVFVTHDQTEALTMADRIAVLNFGELQQVGSPKELYERPASAFVAGFIGETNFWPARARADAAAGTEAEVELDGGDVARVLAVEALKRGQAAQVAIRPEHIKLAPNGIGATVEDAIYAGSITTLLARTRGPMLRVRLETPDATPGGTIALGWEARNARAYAAP